MNTDQMNTYGADIDPEEDYGWTCEECGHQFWVAGASSMEYGDEIIPGVQCPECGAFVADEDEE